MKKYWIVVSYLIIVRSMSSTRSEVGFLNFCALSTRKENNKKTKVKSAHPSITNFRRPQLVNRNENNLLQLEQKHDYNKYCTSKTY